MTDGNNHHAPAFGTLLGRMARSGLGAVQNRFELLALEWQEERARMAELLFWVVGVLFFALMALLLLTATIIFLFREELRLYIAAGFSVLYLLGAGAAWFGLKSILKQEPFPDTIDQAKKDRQWLSSLD
jgi:uncharacterized membrane protein YqjE